MTDQPRCTCDSSGGGSAHRDYCELNHPHHPCDERSCRYAPATAPAGLDHCQVVEIPTADGPRTIRVHTGAPVSPQAAHALGALVEVAGAELAAEHPHVIQELVLAFAHLRIQPELVGRLMPHKARMSDAIAAVRQALDEAAAEAAKLRAVHEHLKGRRRTWLLRYRDVRDELANERDENRTGSLAETVKVWHGRCLDAEAELAETRAALTAALEGQAPPGQPTYGALVEQVAELTQEHGVVSGELAAKDAEIRRLRELLRGRGL